jgi:hypothetical protein
VCAVSRSRAFDGSGEPNRPAGLDERSNVVDSRFVVEVGRQEPARIVLDKRIDPDYVTAL